MRPTLVCRAHIGTARMNDSGYLRVGLSTQAVTLVIDDGPTSATRTLIDSLEMNGHRAVLFVLGRNMAGNDTVLIDAIQRGFALGNHSFSHPRFSGIDVDVARDEIVHTDMLIDHLYRAAGISRPGRWFRFPYLDTGGEKHACFQTLLSEMHFTMPDAVRVRMPACDQQRHDWPSTVLTRDWASPSQRKFRATLMTAVPDDVIEYHDKVESIVQYRAALIRALRDRLLRAAIPADAVHPVMPTDARGRHAHA